MKRTTYCTFWAVVLSLLVFAPRAWSETLGTTATAITAAGSRGRETTAGNLVADALKAVTRADAAIVPGDAFTDASIAAGPVTRDALKELLTDPDDEVAVITMTGAQLRVALERSVSAHPKPFDGFLQLSGITVEFDSGRAPGPRLIKVKVNGADLDQARKYKVAALNTLASGGLGYYRMWSDKDVARTGRSVLDTVAGYITQQQTVSPKADNRLAAR